MIDASPAVGQSAPAGQDDCPWLDYLRGPEGSNHLKCRLTGHIFGAGRREEAICLRLCAYPKQHIRGRCDHMELTNILMTEGDPPLPRIGCAAHRNWDAPGYCFSCKDYSAADR